MARARGLELAAAPRPTELRPISTVPDGCRRRSALPASAITTKTLQLPHRTVVCRQRLSSGTHRRHAAGRNHKSRRSAAAICNRWKPVRLGNADGLIGSRCRIKSPALSDGAHSKSLSQNSRDPVALPSRVALPSCAVRPGGSFPRLSLAARGIRASARACRPPASPWQRAKSRSRSLRRAARQPMV